MTANRVGVALVWMLLTAAFVFASPQGVADRYGWVATAHADDGDSDSDGDGDSDSDGDGGAGGGGAGGGGAGGGGSGSGGGGHGASSSGGEGGFFNLFKSRKPQRKRKRKSSRTRRAAVQQHASGEIVALGLSDGELDVLTGQGYAVLQRQQILIAQQQMVRIRVPGGTNLEAARAAIRQVNPVAIADFNHFYRTEADDVPAASCNGPGCLAVEQIAWPLSHSSSNSCFADMRIGLIDTGINADHATFSGRKLEVFTTAEENVRSSSRSHGTAVAALLLGSSDSRTPGLLSNATVIGVDAFYRSGGRDQRSDVYTLARSLDLLAGKNVSVINLSLSGPANMLLAEMVRLVDKLDISLVAAAGNRGPRAKPVYPAAYPGVIAVTAIDRNKRIYRRAGQGEHIDLAAPGVKVWTAASVRGARTKTGTSFAAPFVTAAVALARISLNLRKHEDIMTVLAGQAVDLGKPGKDPVFGHGLVQATGRCNP